MIIAIPMIIHGLPLLLVLIVFMTVYQGLLYCIKLHTDIRYIQLQLITYKSNKINPKKCKRKKNK